MALTTPFYCDCGKVYIIYIPKRMLFREMFKGGGVKLGTLIDKKERERGEVALAQETAEFSGYEFRDVGINEIIQCECGAVYDVLRAIYLSIKFPDLKVLNYREVRTNKSLDIS